jgi:2-polyprenyl-3-methyl-5-hydroxy-6-metoxy-1,4-benzoquinol methylase
MKPGGGFAARQRLSYTARRMETPDTLRQQTTAAAGAGSRRFTGERPGWGEGFEYDFARHIVAYRYAATLVAGKRVLDAGCGEGFGTHTLADAAGEVVGVDYDEGAIADCRASWTGAERPNLRFEHVDLTNPGGFHELFDVVLNFQVLEHIQTPRPFLEALKARLAPGGFLLLTTPNRLRTVSENPYHVREYTEPELHQELSAVFPSVEIRGVFGNAAVEAFESRRAAAVQSILRLDPLGLRNLLPKSLVEFAFARLAKIVRKQASPSDQPLIRPEDFSVRTDGIERALDLMAVCRAA